MKNYNMVLTEKQQKCRHYNHLKLIIMNFLQLKKYYHLVKVESAKFTFSLLHKVFEKKIKKLRDQGIKQFEDLKALKNKQITREK